MRLRKRKEIKKLRTKDTTKPPHWLLAAGGKRKFEVAEYVHEHEAMANGMMGNEQNNM